MCEQSRTPVPKRKHLYIPDQLCKKRWRPRDRTRERERALLKPSEDEKREATGMKPRPLPDRSSITSTKPASSHGSPPGVCVFLTPRVNSTETARDRTDRERDYTYVCLTWPYNLTFGTTISNRLPFSLLPLDTHGFIYTHTYSAEHIWFCFANSVANDLTTPYKACLVPLILSWEMKTHTENPRWLCCVWSDGMTGGDGRDNEGNIDGEKGGKRWPSWRNN